MSSEEMVPEEVREEKPESVEQPQPQPQPQKVESFEELVKKLEDLLNTMKDWERRPLVEVGHAVVELVKLPKRQTKRGTEPERLALHLRLRDSFKGVFIESFAELDDILRALNTKRVQDIARALDELSKKRVIEYGL